MDVSAAVVKFRVSGKLFDDDAVKLLIPPEVAQGCTSMSVYAVHSHRSSENAVPVQAQLGTDVVIIKIAGGPVLVLHPDSARALLTSGAATRRDQFLDAIPVTATLPWTTDQPAERGGTLAAVGTVLQWFGVVRFDPLNAAQNTAMLIAEKIDAGVREGLYHLQSDALPAHLDQGQLATAQSLSGLEGKPLLVLVHGTFVNTASTFGKLWSRHADIVCELFKQYDNRVFAFDHPTMLASPIANALALAQALPERAVVDLVTHSRGGQLAEILVRAGAENFNRQDAANHFPSLTHGDGAAVLALHQVLRAKNISVRRVVRVACPARGTLLASGRLDAYLSVFSWLLQEAMPAPVALLLDPLLAFLREVARQGTRPEVLPGIAAMEPGSAIVKWLNAPIERVNSSLYVLAGDSSGDTIGSWLTTLMADAFYWTDNDLIVQTRSMYGGVPRIATSAAKFMRFEGAQVSHFSYFSFAESAKALADALHPSPRGEWKLIGPMSWAGKDAGGLRTISPSAGTAPCVFVIPDFFGSHLEDPAQGGRRVWLSENSPADFSALDPGIRLNATGLVMEGYGKLCERLAETHEVIPFPYDWRLSLDGAANQLAAAITERLDDPRHRARPIRLAAHGGGGLVVRLLHLTERAVWDRMMAVDGARILMLGVPQQGTWTPLQALSGDDSFGNILGSTGTLFSGAAARKTLARMPGFVQLQASLDDPMHNLKDRSSWVALEKTQQDMLAARSSWHQLDAAWAIPEQSILDAARSMWRKLDQEAASLGGDREKIVLVAGAASNTPSGITRADNELLIDCVCDGDGRVTLDSARLAGNKIWRIPAEHGHMAMALPNFGALVELLTDGTTTQLEPSGVTDANPVVCKARRFRHAHSADLPGELAALFSVRADDVAALQLDDRLAVRVYHSDLRFVRVPLIVGHYQSLSLTGSEAVVDSLVNGRMSKALRAGIYPDRVGNHQIFENGHHVGFRRHKQRFIPRPKAAIVVGLGEEGKLNAQHLSFTIRNGILAFAERLAESVEPVATFKIAATLIGSGGTGVTISNAALALVQGILDANQRLKEASWPQVTGLEIVEMYLDRATDAWRALTAHAEANPERLIVEKVLAEGDGRMRRPLDASYRGATYDFISAVRADSSQPGAPVIAYSLDTKRARTEVRAQRAQGPLLHDLIAKASNSSRTDPLIGRTLFNLLVPVEIEPFLAGSTDMVMELDEHTSALPWELLETDPDIKLRQGNGQDMPWAIRSKVIRKLQVEKYRAQIVDASVEDNILIIGEPKVDGRYDRLPGAQREAKSIGKAARSALGNAPGRVTLLADSDDAHAIINQLFARNYRMVHIAGHGTGGPEGGVVLSGTDTFLGRNEIESMRVTPELVFVNCCYLGQRKHEQDYDRVTFAASIAEALIKLGVRCVVAAGWAVEDIPAERFANSFYTALFDGDRFIDAVGAGRKAAWLANPVGNTWAAYQCYGDPDWSFRTAKSAVHPSPEEEYAGVASSSTLIMALQSIAIEALYTAPEAKIRHSKRLVHLEEKFKDWTTKGDVAEEFGNAYAALPDRLAAQDWYARARVAPDGSASLQALEFLAEQSSLPGATEAELSNAITILRSMVDLFGPTLRRLSLLGNAHKRLSTVMSGTNAAGKSLAEEHLGCAIAWFTEATKLPSPDAYDFYPVRAIVECKLRQWMLAETTMVPSHWEQEALANIERLTDRAAHDNPNFWSIVAQTQLGIIKAIMRCRLHRTFYEIDRSLTDLQKRIATQRFWIYIRSDTRFLLKPYLAHATSTDGQERAAAQKLLVQLDGYCGGP